MLSPSFHIFYGLFFKDSQINLVSKYLLDKVGGVGCFVYLGILIWIDYDKNKAQEYKHQGA